MTTFGVVPTGFLRKPLESILAELQADQLADIAVDFDVSTDSVPGQLNGIFARQLSIAWENLEVCYHGNDPDAAENRLLEIICKLTGTFRRGSTPSAVVLTCSLDAGTVLVANEAFAAVTNKPDVRWTPSATFTAPSTGSFPVPFVSEQTGPVPGFAGTIAVIATPVVGWHTVVNPSDAALGLVTDLDPALRLRRERDLATAGSATVRAIEANLSTAFPAAIQNLSVTENDTDSVDADGRSPHCVEALIFDGEVPAASNDAVAQVIFDSKAGGIATWGNATGNATTSVGGTVPIQFSRATQRLVYLAFVLTRGAGYVGDDAVTQYVTTQADALFGPGADVIASVIQSLPLALAGVKDVVSVKLGFAPAPTASVNLSVGIREVARFSTSRIVLA